MSRLFPLVTAECGSALFLPFTRDEARSLSACAVTNPEPRDAMNAPLPGGYYDLRMGPLRKNETCVTCGKRWEDCLGHPGRIELPCTLYNPTFFPFVRKLLTKTCRACKRFRVPSSHARAAETKLLLLDAGLVVEAGSIDLTTKTLSGELLDSLPKLEEQALDVFRRTRRVARPTTTSQKMRQSIWDSLTSSLGLPSWNSCPTCGTAASKFWITNSVRVYRRLSKVEQREASAGLTPGLREEPFAPGGEGPEDAQAVPQGLSDDQLGVYLSPQDIMDYFSQLVAENTLLFSLLFGRAHTTPLTDEQIASRAVRLPFQPSSFFLDCLLIPPNRVRAPAFVNGIVADHKLTHSIKDILLRIQDVYRSAEGGAPSGSGAVMLEGGLAGGADATFPGGVGAHASFPSTRSIVALQEAVNVFVDANTSKSRTDVPGIKQLLERKTGLFRKNIQGKRANFTARSVVAPEINEMDCEIGMPDYFVKTLTYAEPVNEQNAEFLRKLIMNGPIYPGATQLIDETGGRKYLASMTPEARKAEADKLLSLSGAVGPSAGSQGQEGPESAAPAAIQAGRHILRPLIPKVVLRHALPGDPVLINRQPSLHRSSILSHRVRVIPGHARALRLHPVCCAAMNCDFDGDEINAYYPQTPQAAAEAEELMLTSKHYVTPQAGEPIRGLIQDHVLGGVLLTRPGMFLEKQAFGEYCAVACDGLAAVSKPGDSALAQAERERALIGVQALNRIRTDNCFSATNDMRYLGELTRLAPGSFAEQAGQASRAHRAAVGASTAAAASAVSASASASAVPWIGDKRVWLRRTNGDSFQYVSWEYSPFQEQENQFSSRKVTASDAGAVVVPEPAICFPGPVWTGKQVVTSMIRTLVGDQYLPNVQGGTRLPDYFWGPLAQQEATVRVVQGELVTGIVAKKHVAASAGGLVHALFELYGSQAAGRFLSHYGRLATYTLQRTGFTCSLQDMILKAAADARRRQLFSEARAAGLQTARDYLQSEGLPSGPGHVASGLRGLLHGPNARGLGYYDAHMTRAANGITTELMKACGPRNLALSCQSRFSSALGGTSSLTFNALGYMILAGSKGSGVNLQMMTTCLGQQSLEGRRVPLTPAGKTLPCHRPYDNYGFISGGYIFDRFLTGLRPSSFYYHCMAGREGLVDTAVKTATSGYFQRVVIKSIESMRIAYDGTVRDGDGSLVQLLYGGDGMDTTRQGYLRDFPFMLRNLERYAERYKDVLDSVAGSKVIRKAGKFVDAAREAGLIDDQGRMLRKGSGALSKSTAKALDKALRPLRAISFLNRLAGETLTEGSAAAVASFLASTPPQNLFSPYTTAGSTSSSFSADLRGAVEQLREGGPERVPCAAEAASQLGDSAEAQGRALEAIAEIRYMGSLMNPGEAVGVLAGQSVGEPATQLTLNTFHLAGHGGANVTLGIPRLCELVMMAASVIKTPVITIPLLRDPDHNLLARLQRLTLAELVQALRVREEIVRPNRRYVLTLEFPSFEELDARAGIRPPALREIMLGIFLPKLLRAVRGALARRGVASLAPQNVAVNDFDTGRAPRGDGDQDDRDDREDRDEREERSGSDAEESESSSESADDEAARIAKGIKDDDAADDEAADAPVVAERDSDAANVADAADAAVEEGSEPEAPSVAGETPMAQKRTAITEGEIRAWEGPISELDLPNTMRGEKAANAPFRVSGSFSRASAGSPPRMDLSLTLHARDKVLVISLAEEVLHAAVAREVKGLNRCRVRTEGKQRVLESESSGLLAARLLPPEIVDFDNLYCNDVAAILRAYGVEAAREALVQEMAKVFGVYHIAVDERHLSVIADAMMRTGEYLPLNRRGISWCPQPLQRASFESGCTVLSQTSAFAIQDYLESPSAAITFGQHPTAGTGAFRLFHEIPAVEAAGEAE